MTCSGPGMRSPAFQFDFLRNDALHLWGETLASRGENTSITRSGAPCLLNTELRAHIMLCCGGAPFAFTHCRASRLRIGPPWRKRSTHRGLRETRGSLNKRSASGRFPSPSNARHGPASEARGDTLRAQIRACPSTRNITSRTHRRPRARAPRAAISLRCTRAGPCHKVCTSKHSPSIASRRLSEPGARNHWRNTEARAAFDSNFKCGRIRRRVRERVAAQPSALSRRMP